jgi:DNA-directed RNA polymerase subunit RPC12/RpoP
MRFHCPNCHSALEAANPISGQKYRCPHCGQKLCLPRKPTLDQTRMADLPDLHKTRLVEETVLPPSSRQSNLSSQEHSAPQPIVLEYHRAGADRFRWLTLTGLLVLLTAGFLPWAEVTFNTKNLHLRVTESGFQSLYGGFSLPPGMSALFQYSQKNSPPPDSQQLQKTLDFERADILMSASPFLVVNWASLLVSGLVILLYPLGNTRSVYLGCLLGIIFVTLFLHHLTGLPLERRVNFAIHENIEFYENDATIPLSTTTDETPWYWACVGIILVTGVGEFLLFSLRSAAPGTVALHTQVGVVGIFLILLTFGIGCQMIGREIFFSDQGKKIARLQATEQAARDERERQRQEEEAAARARERKIAEAQAQAKAAAEAAERQEKAREHELELKRQELALEQERQRFEEAKRLQERERKLKELELQRQAEALAKQQEAEAREQARRKALEDKGLPIYPLPATRYKGFTAEEWYNQTTKNSRNSRLRIQALDALAALKEEGIPYLLRLLPSYISMDERDDVFERINPDFVHPNDVPRIIDCLNLAQYSLTTRMRALRALTRIPGAKRHLKGIREAVDDLTDRPKYEAEVKSLLTTIAQKG